MEIERKNQDAIRCLLVGCGNIGSKWDEDSLKDDSSLVRTHLKALKHNSGYQIQGIYDVDESRALSASKFWGDVPVVKELEDFDYTSIDLVILATPAEGRLELIKFLVSKKIKYIFAEKPLEKEAALGSDIVKLVEDHKVCLLVNYSRTFNSEFDRLVDEINAGKYGELKAGSVIYGKGFNNNGSHVVSTLASFFPSLSKLVKTSVLDDQFTHDPTYNFTLTDGSVQISVVATDYRDYSVMEYDFFFSRARIKIKDAGRTIEIFKVIPDPVYVNYQILKLEETRKAQLDRVLVETYDKLQQAMSGKNDLIQTNFLLTKRLINLYLSSNN